MTQYYGVVLSTPFSKEGYPYLELAREAKRQHSHVIDDPDMVAVVAHKARFRETLVNNRIPVPETVMVGRDELSNYKVTDQVRNLVGSPFVVKPAWGDSGVGVIVNADSEFDLHKSAEQAPNADSFLIQQQVTPRLLGRYLGWFRLLHICGETIPCWWDPSTHQYHLVTPAEQRAYRLGALHRIMRGVARASKMRKFSSEICLNDDDGKFYLVDYINADPDMNPQSFYTNGCLMK